MTVDAKLADEAVAIADELDTLETLLRAVAVLRDIRDAPEDGLSPRQLVELRRLAKEAGRLAAGISLEAKREIGKVLRQITSAATGAEPATTQSELVSPATYSTKR